MMEAIIQAVLIGAIIGIVFCSLVGIGVYLIQFTDWLKDGFSPDDEDEDESI